MAEPQATQAQSAPKVRRAQAVLFLLAESELFPQVTETASAPLTIQKVRREPLNKLPLVPAGEFSKGLERFFLKKTAASNSNTAMFSDAALLLFPLRSMRGIFTWVTSIAQLQAFDRQLKDTTCSPRWPIVGLDESKLLSGPNNAAVFKQHVSLEEYSMPVEVEPRVQGISRWLAGNALPQSSEFQWWRAKLARDLVVVPHELFIRLVDQHLQFAAGDQGSLREAIPKETVFYSILGPTLAESQLELPLTRFGDFGQQGAGLCRLQLITRANNKARRKKKKKKAPEAAKETSADTAEKPQESAPAVKEEDASNE